ncbi:MAG: transcription antitermination factor NusB [Prevotellaceae bacterium]|jgi:N utilization substance protein B|nr:transcription antitermination factor NusB [Prevotellaceae bacterium]
MITRALLRTKAIQILYASYQSGNLNLKHVDNDLSFSIEKAYDLYHYLLLLPIELTRYADRRIEAAQRKLRPTEADLNPNRRFVDNMFVAQLSQNTALQTYISKHKLSWANHQEMIRALFERLEATSYYQAYLSAETSNYEQDKELWRIFFKRELHGNNDFEDLLEEMSIYWLDDMDTIISFILKTVKHFVKKTEENQPLLSIENDREDREFISQLVHQLILNNAEYDTLIDKFTNNWDIERIAFMDTLILRMAVAELSDFPTIPVNVTLNEYIEIAKYYSTPRSHIFVNGVLDQIVSHLRKEKKLQKVGETENNQE